MGDDSYVGIDPSKCAGCLQCVKNCPAKALSYEGEAKDVSNNTLLTPSASCYLKRL